MTNPQKDANLSDSLRLPQKELDGLLAENDRSCDEGGPSRRRMRRRTMDGRKLVVVVIGANNERKNVVAVGRNLSSTGVGFLCGGFLHPGQRCVVAIRELDGKAHGINGKIMRCGHIKGQVHDVGVRFDEAIKPSLFIETKGDDAFNIENVDPDELEGTMLIVDDSRADQRLMAHHLKATKLDLTFMGDGAGGLQSLADQPDMVLCDFNLPDMNGTEWVTKAREQGYIRPVLLVTAETSFSVHTAARNAGCDAVIVKPITRKGVMQAIAEFLIGDSSSQSQVSTASLGLDDELITQYVNDLYKYAEDIANAIEKQDSQVLRSLLLEIRGTASGHGFGSVSELAEAAEKSLSGSMDINESLTDIQRLISACESARMPKSADAKDKAK